MLDYSAKSEIYFDNPRQDIAALLPPGLQRVLEIGCGSGATLKWLRESGRAVETVGVEAHEAAAARARLHVDEVCVGNAELLIDEGFPTGLFDCVLCLDVLEHMLDPWAFLGKLRQHVRPGGTLIASIPNVRNIKVLLPLIFRGRWDYQDAGLLDRTHLRFFTRASALELIEQGGFSVTKHVCNLPAATRRLGPFNPFSWGLIADFVTLQYLIAARRPELD